ncbi:MAG TPA: class I lanthipeptide [Thermoanaerobaculia bacterium]|nr:class I lanthipeptide [Thermoanaerobaculia bacterium]
MKKKTKKLGLTRETLTNLNSASLEHAAGAVSGGHKTCCQESNVICSVQHTCVSCVATDATCA